MKKVFSLFAVMMLAAGLMSSCDAASELCGPCGEVTMGDSTISGDARLDGFFKAVGTLGSATAKIQADFRGEVEALGEAFGVCAAIVSEFDTDTSDDLTPCSEFSLDELVAEVQGEIQAEFDANASAGLTVKFEPPKCSANVSVAVEAQASCEAKADCDVSAECSGGEVSVQCEGQCSGGCDATCSGGCSVKVDAACSGVCKGQCELSAAATCEGTCNGTCSGTCSLQDAEGNCKGECDGDCQGSCEVEGGASCSGTCHGECVVEAEAECSGKCEGECSGSCSGGCEGTATPPSCSAEGECEASADCQASASAEASASMECTPPSIAIDFNYSGAAGGEAAFLAKIETFRVKMIAIVQGMFKLRALVDADYAAEIGIESPVAVIEGQIEGMMEADISSFNVAPGLIPCVIPAFEDSITIIGDVATDTVGTIQGQLSFFAILNVG